MKNQILQEVAVASSDLASATARIAVGKDQVIQAQEDYRMALKRYEAQVGTNIDVLDARVSLIAALNALADAIYDAATAEAGLVYVVGAGSIRED
jgi:outer membrane protein TolC